MKRSYSTKGDSSDILELYRFLYSTINQENINFQSFISISFQPKVEKQESRRIKNTNCQNAHRLFFDTMLLQDIPFALNQP